jgi:hypothetical protein
VVLQLAAWMEELISHHIKTPACHKMLKQELRLGKILWYDEI